MKNLRSLAAALGATAVAASAALVFSPVAGAIGPNGVATVDSEGTYSKVWPTTLSPCDTINFELTGYPVGSVVSIKISDGLFSSGDKSIQGQGVVHKQTVDSNGVATGSFNLPCDLPEGDHWLRYLTSVPRPGGDEGEKLGYSNRGDSDFHVVAAGSQDSNSDSDSTSDSGTTNSGNSNSAATNSGSKSNSGDNSGAGVVGGGSDNDSGGAARVTTTRRVAGSANSGGSASGGSAGSQGGSSNTGVNGAAPTNASGKPMSSNEILKAQGGKASGGSQGEEVVYQDSAGNYVLAQNSRQAPVVGLTIGGSILVVGLAAVAAYLYVNAGKRKRSE